MCLCDILAVKKEFENVKETTVIQYIFIKKDVPCCLKYPKSGSSEARAYQESDLHAKFCLYRHVVVLSYRRTFVRGGIDLNVHLGRFNNGRQSVSVVWFFRAKCFSSDMPLYRTPSLFPLLYCPTRISMFDWDDSSSLPRPWCPFWRVRLGNPEPRSGMGPRGWRKGRPRSRD